MLLFVTIDVKHPAKVSSFEEEKRMFMGEARAGTPLEIG